MSKDFSNFYTDIDRLKELNLKYKYKELILKGKIKISNNKKSIRKNIKKILGPDCAYHLYKFND